MILLGFHLKGPVCPSERIHVSCLGRCHPSTCNLGHRSAYQICPTAPRLLRRLLTYCVPRLGRKRTCTSAASDVQFLTGLFRSGSQQIRLLLRAHSAVCLRGYFRPNLRYRCQWRYELTAYGFVVQTDRLL